MLCCSVADILGQSGCTLYSGCLHLELMLRYLVVRYLVLRFLVLRYLILRYLVFGEYIIQW
jgi:hypothetical protein